MMTLEQALERHPLDPARPGHTAAALAGLLANEGQPLLRWHDCVSHRGARDPQGLDATYRERPVQPIPIGGVGLDLDALPRETAPFLAALTLAQAHLDHEAGTDDLPVLEEGLEYKEYARRYRLRQMRVALFTLVASNKAARDVLVELTAR